MKGIDYHTALIIGLGSAAAYVLVEWLKKEWR